jgi:hypothetical protein
MSVRDEDFVLPIVDGEDLNDKAMVMASLSRPFKPSVPRKDKASWPKDRFTMFVKDKDLILREIHDDDGATSMRMDDELIADITDNETEETGVSLVASATTERNDNSESPEAAILPRSDTVLMARDEIVATTGHALERSMSSPFGRRGSLKTAGQKTILAKSSQTKSATFALYKDEDLFIPEGFAEEGKPSSSQQVTAKKVTSPPKASGLLTAGSVLIKVLPGIVGKVLAAVALGKTIYGVWKGYREKEEMTSPSEPVVVKEVGKKVVEETAATLAELEKKLEAILSQQDKMLEEALAAERKRAAAERQKLKETMLATMEREQDLLREELQYQFAELRKSLLEAQEPE